MFRAALEILYDGTGAQTYFGAWTIEPSTVLLHIKSVNHYNLRVEKAEGGMHSQQTYMFTTFFPLPFFKRGMNAAVVSCTLSTLTSRA